ncbi:DUF4913 domain-containing protein [Streptomyces olivaceoviridis]
MSKSVPDLTPPDEASPGKAPPTAPPPFILYQQGEDFQTELQALVFWVHQLLLPVYGREISSNAPWCPRWWEHIEAVAQLHALQMAWQELTSGDAALTGPATWHRDFLAPVLTTLRDPNGPFAGCKAGNHRLKEPPHVDGP